LSSLKSALGITDGCTITTGTFTTTSGGSSGKVTLGFRPKLLIAVCNQDGNNQNGKIFLSIDIGNTIVGIRWVNDYAGASCGSSVLTSTGFNSINYLWTNETYSYLVLS